MNFIKDFRQIAKFLWISTQPIQIRRDFLEAYHLGLPVEQCCPEEINPKILLKIIEDLEKVQKSGIQAIDYLDPLYPRQLKEIADPPLVLFFAGNLATYDFEQPAWGIVGARKASVKGVNLAQQIALLLASRRQKVVSGLAIGIDASAHLGALSSGQPACTLAVLGNGLPNIYPATNHNLAKKIIQNEGLICSQFYPLSNAYPANFLNRNRLIAGFVDNLLVIEASEQSGSRVTARYALEQGKNLYVVPGDISNMNYRGSNQLLKQGAEIITCIEDFEDLVPDLNPRPKILFTVTQELIYQAIKSSNLISVSDLMAKVLQEGIAHEIFYQDLIWLENQGKIKTLPGELVQVS